MTDDYEYRDVTMKNIKDILVAILAITLLLLAGIDW